MFSLSEPTFAEIKEYLWNCRSLDFSYDGVGHTREGRSPTGFHLDRARIRLGSGRRCFLSARRAIDEWRMFPIHFARIFWAGRIVPDKTVAVRMRSLGMLWSVNPCRIVYTLDGTASENGQAVDTYGFAYGTLPGHVETGEERFSVRYCHADESVWYEIFCFSRPAHILAKLAHPYVRLTQARFRHLSGLSMRAAVMGMGSTVKKPTNYLPPRQTNAAHDYWLT